MHTTLLALLQKLEYQLGHAVERRFVEARVGDVWASQADPLRLGELFPGSEPTPLRDGLAATVWLGKEITQEGPRL